MLIRLTCCGQGSINLPFHPFTSDDIPNDDICILTPASQTEALFIKAQGSNRFSVAIESNEYIPRGGFPEPNGTIRITDCKNIALCRYGDTGHFSSMTCIVPHRKLNIFSRRLKQSGFQYHLTFFDVPYQDVF